MQRRNRPGKRSSASSFRWIGGLVVMGLICAGVLVMLAPTLVTNYIRAYLQKDDFRHKVEELVAARVGGSVHLAPILWNDDNATAADFSVDSPVWKLEASGLHAALEFSAIRNGKWSIQNAGADELIVKRMPAGEMSRADEGLAADFDSSGDGIPSFLRRYIPTKTRISGFDVHRFVFEQEGWKISETGLSLGGWQSGEVSVQAKLNGGKLQTPIQAPEQKEPLLFDVAKATLRAGKNQIQVSDATLRWKQGAEATMRGSLKHDTGAWQMLVHAKAVPLDEFLDEWWRQRLSGKVEGDVELSGAHGAAMAWKVNAALKGGELTGLPILDKLVTYTNTQRFKRVVLDICSASFRPQGDALRVENIIVQSNGLLRVEGSLNIRGRGVDGDFMLGVTPETLSSIPGAASRVFVEAGSPGAPPGLKWARVRVAGTIEAPQEDLSSRLVGAAGMSLLFDTPGTLVGTGAETLLKPVLGEDAAKMPGKILDSASGVIENGVNAGSGLINKVLPIFPVK